MWVQIGLLCFSLFCSFALNAVIQSMLSTHGSFWCHWEWMSLLDVCRCSTWAEANMETPSTCILSIRHQGAIVVVPNTEEHFPLYAYAHWLHTFTWTIETSLQFNHTMNENFEMGRGLRHASVIFTGDRLVNNAGVFSFNGWCQKSVCLVKNTLVSKVGSDRIGQEKEKMQLFSNYQL